MVGAPGARVNTNNAAIVKLNAFVRVNIFCLLLLIFACEQTAPDEAVSRRGHRPYGGEYTTALLTTTLYLASEASTL